MILDAPNRHISKRHCWHFSSGTLGGKKQSTHFPTLSITVNLGAIGMLIGDGNALFAKISSLDPRRGRL